VFSALDSLIEEPMAVVAPPTVEPPPPGIPAPLVNAVPPAPTSEPIEDAPETPSAPDAAEGEAAETEVADWSETFPEPPPPRRWPWVIGSLVALMAFGLQTVLAFRVELAVLWPDARPALIALCNVADCKVGLPTKATLVGIEASDLHPDTEHAGRLALTATLKNRAPFAQQFPHLELTLTDLADRAVARKVLAPADYLTPSSAIAEGMQPNADIMVAVGVDPREMEASGYRLYLFYP
jgi:hypothetical protein